MISCLCNELFTGLQHDTTLDSLSALEREISLKNIHTYIVTYKHDLSQFSFACWYSSFVPLALSLCLNNHALALKKEDVGY